jgi:biotin-dependent carboxylase-like uncharacterized protein
MTKATSNAVLRVLDTGLGASIQDAGRRGWQRFGVPQSGWMDEHAARTAHRLLENDPGAPLLEMLLQGAMIEALQSVWIALTGADVDATIPTWRVCHLAAGEVVHLRSCRSGVWSYLAVEGGFEAPRVFASYYARGKIGEPVIQGTSLARADRERFSLPVAVSGRTAPWADRRDYSAPPAIRVWHGPQWDQFSAEARDVFLGSEWKVSAQSDRVGYRLTGPAIPGERPNLASEPVRFGSVQIPNGGQPIVTMKDGPTVGGYPKIALVEPEDLAWVAQTRPGLSVRFKLIEE